CRRGRALADVELRGGAALHVDLAHALRERVRAQQEDRDREGAGHRKPSYSSFQYSPSNGQYSSSSPIRPCSHSWPCSSAGKRPAARSLTSMSSLRFWPITASILPSLALSSTRRVSM